MEIPDHQRRLFLAVDIDTEIRHGLAAHLTRNLAGEELPGSSPPAENWHITLRFLGNLGPARYDRLLARLDEADLGDSFEVRFGGLGAFPNPRRATVLWLGFERGSEELSRLAAAAEEAAVAAGSMPEERPFHPHLTLSRVRPQRDVRKLIEHVPDFPLVQTVGQLTVFESHLGSGPAVYKALERFELG